VATNLSFATSALSAALGIGLGVAGIAHGDFKQTATGLILILGGEVFALLCIGLRRPRYVPNDPEDAK
jgi:hypothetical protein